VLCCNIINTYIAGTAVWEVGFAQAGADRAEKLLNHVTKQLSCEVNPLNEFSSFLGSISEEYPRLGKKFVID